MNPNPPLLLSLAVQIWSVRQKNTDHRSCVPNAGQSPRLQSGYVPLEKARRIRGRRAAPACRRRGAGCFMRIATLPQVEVSNLMTVDVLRDSPPVPRGHDQEIRTIPARPWWRTIAQIRLPTPGSLNWPKSSRSVPAAYSWSRARRAT